MGYEESGRMPGEDEGEKGNGNENMRAKLVLTKV